jgi:hypothetical protein
MTTTIAPVDYDQLALLVESPPQLLQFLAESVRVADFRQTTATEACYFYVASFLEDGWTSAQCYLRLKPEVTFSLDVFGHMMNRIVSGHRYSQRRANLVMEEAHLSVAPWLGAGEWPTRLDAAAYLYFICCDPVR